MSFYKPFVAKRERQYIRSLQRKLADKNFDANTGKVFITLPIKSHEECFNIRVSFYKPFVAKRERQYIRSLQRKLADKNFDANTGKVFITLPIKSHEECFNIRVSFYKPFVAKRERQYIRSLQRKLADKNFDANTGKVVKYCCNFKLLEEKCREF